MNVSARFGQIFWGLFFVLVDVRFNGFDVLPDLIGYILVALGCGGLAHISKHFVTARALSGVLSFLWLIDFIPKSREWDTVVWLVNLLVRCAWMWSLLGGVMEYAEERARPDLSERASNRRQAYIFLMCITTLVGWMSRGSRHAEPIVILLLIAGLTIMVLILHLIHRVMHELAVD